MTDPLDDYLILAVKIMAVHIGEKHPRPMAALLDLARAKGLGWMQTLINEATILHGQGELKRRNGTTRTLGGAVFRLAKERIGPEDYLKVVTSEVAHRKLLKAQRRASKKRRYKANLKARKLAAAQPPEAQHAPA